MGRRKKVVEPPLEADQTAIDPAAIADVAGDVSPEPEQKKKKSQKLTDARVEELAGQVSVGLSLVTEQIAAKLKLPEAHIQPTEGYGVSKASLNVYRQYRASLPDNKTMAWLILAGALVILIGLHVAAYRARKEREKDHERIKSIRDSAAGGQAAHAPGEAGQP